LSFSIFKVPWHPWHPKISGLVKDDQNSFEWALSAGPRVDRRRGEGMVERRVGLGGRCCGDDRLPVGSIITGPIL
jgi:hypothetical protein